MEVLDDSRLRRAGTCVLATAGSAALLAVVSILTTVLVGGCDMASEEALEGLASKVKVRNAGWCRVSLCLNSQDRL